MVMILTQYNLLQNLWNYVQRLYENLTSDRSVSLSPSSNKLYYIYYIYLRVMIGDYLRGSSGPKFLKTSFRVNGWPKRLTQWANFLVGYWGPRFFGATVAATPIFPRKIGYFPKSIKITISYHQSIDNSLLSYQKKCQPDWTKNGWVMTKKRMPIYGIIYILRAILAHNLAKYQNFPMRPSLFDKYHQITHSQQFVA